LKRRQISGVVQPDMTRKRHAKANGVATGSYALFKTYTHKLYAGHLQSFYVNSITAEASAYFLW